MHQANVFWVPTCVHCVGPLHYDDIQEIWTHDRPDFPHTCEFKADPLSGGWVCKCGLQAKVTT